MRTFLSLDIENEGVLGEMLKVEDELSRTGADLKLVEKENLHFTVKFFGEIPEAQVDEIDRRIKNLELHAMQVSVRGVGVFPDMHYPRVVWAGVALADLVSISSVAEVVIKSVNGIGEPDDRKYHPHVTLARVKTGRNKQELIKYLENNRERDFGASPIRTLTLRSSTLTPRGPVYTPLKVYALK